MKKHIVLLILISVIVQLLEVSVGVIVRHTFASLSVNSVLKQSFKKSASSLSLLAVTHLFLNAPDLYAQEPDIQVVSKENETLFMAKKAFEDGFYEVSLGLSERFLANYPDSNLAPDARLLSAECYFYQNRFLEALKRLEILLTDPGAIKLKDAIYYWIAETYFKANNFQKAADYYKIILRDFTNSTYTCAANYSYGWSNLELGNFAQAMESFTILEKKFSRQPQAKDAGLKIIECLYNLKNYASLKEKIKPYFKLYASDKQKLSYLYFYLAEAHYYLNEWDGALQNYTLAYSLTQDKKIKAQIKLSLAWVNLKLKKYPESADVFLKMDVNLLDKKSVEVYLLGKAAMFSETNRMDEARKTYEELIARSADPLVLVEAYLGVADAFYRLGRYPQAVKVYQEAILRLQKEVSGVQLDRLRYNLGWSYLSLGEIENSIVEFQRIAKNDEVSYALGLAYFRKQDYSVSYAALTEFKTEYVHSALRPQALYLLGSDLFNLAKFREAIDIFKDIARSYAQDTDLAQKAEYEIADCFYRLGEEGEALSRFEGLRSKYQDSSLTPEVLKWLGEYYLRHNNLGLARRYFFSLTKDFPRSNLLAEAYYDLGLTYVQEENFTEAINYFQKVIGMKDGDLSANASSAIAEIYIKYGDYKQARDYYQLSLKDSVLEDVPAIRLKIAETIEAAGDVDLALKEYLELAGMYNTDLTFVVRALLGAAKIYEDEEKFKEALDIYRKVVSAGTDEAKFAEERIGLISANLH